MDYRENNLEHHIVYNKVLLNLIHNTYSLMVELVIKGVVILENLVGKRFGHLKVIDIHNEHAKGVSWECICDCGNTIVIPTIRLLGSKNRRPNRSCGCSQRKYDGNTEKYNRIYKIWFHMVSRCYNMDTSSYGRFGAKGISVCEEWKDNYEPFLEWSLLNGYEDNLYLSRVDKKLNYDPTNCIWADKFKLHENKGLLITNKTGHTGVSIMKSGKYRAYINRKYKRKYLGCFDTLQEAFEAREKAEEEYNRTGKL